VFFTMSEKRKISFPSCVGIVSFLVPQSATDSVQAMAVSVKSGGDTGLGSPVVSFTTPTGTVSPPSSSLPAWLIGVTVVASICFIALIVVVILVVRRRRAHHSDMAEFESHHYVLME
jgi:hypothetical protein